MSPSSTCSTGLRLTYSSPGCFNSDARLASGRRYRRRRQYSIVSVELRGSNLVGVATDFKARPLSPAAMCGIYGLKPSSGRFSTWGVRSGMPGQDSVVRTLETHSPLLMLR